MPDIKISVKDKIAAKTDRTEYICGNSDFNILFAFDAEWDAYETKTARFSYNGSYVDIVFVGNQCAVPVIGDTYHFNVGVYAGDLHTITPAYVPCRKSILCGGGVPAEPPEDVYAQIMELLNSENGVWYPSVDEGVVSWARSISETAPEPVNIQGPKGDTGETGPQGPAASTKNPTFTGNFSINRKAGTTVGINSFAEGYTTTASGDYGSHSEGSNTEALGNVSHAEGYRTIATSLTQHVQGRCNVLDTGGSATQKGKYAHIVGNGTSDADRSNAHTLDWGGNAWFAGDVFVGGTGQDDPSAEKLAKESDLAALEARLAAIEALVGKED